MYYALMRPFDIANGTGIRASLFVSGCTHGCPGCFNEPYQDFKHGTQWSEKAEALFISYIRDENVKGATILGGEPMDQTMDDDLLNLLRRIKSESGKSIWLYSGYTFEEIINDEKKKAILSCCDILVDGQFIENEKDISLKFRGSKNQRIIDVQQSLATAKVVICEM